MALELIEDIEMKDQIRAEFEQEFPLPNGVTFDGDHYVADPNVLGAFQNATIWSHMFRGWKACVQPARQVVEPELISYAEDMSTCTLTLGDGIGYLYSRVTDAELDAKDGHQVGVDEREQFEAWMHTFDIPPQLEGEVFDDENYMDADCFGQFVYDELSTQRCWAAWQARAALAPAAVVMPLYDDPELHTPGSGNQAAAIGYNAALDEVARLNRNPIPVELLERCAERLEYHMCSECKEATCCMPGTRAAAVELRALLGKEGE